MMMALLLYGYCVGVASRKIERAQEAGGRGGPRDGRRPVPGPRLRQGVPAGPHARPRDGSCRLIAHHLDARPMEAPCATEAPCGGGVAVAPRQRCPPRLPAASGRTSPAVGT